jgi:hypothetical protein
MKTLDVVVKRICPNCGFDEILAHKEPPPWFKKPVPQYTGVPMHRGSHMEIRVDLRFICCEHCGNPVMYLHIDTVEKEQPDEQQ